MTAQKKSEFYRQLINDVDLTGIIKCIKEKKRLEKERKIFELNKSLIERVNGKLPFERDVNGRPIAKLTPLKETAVNTPTREEYNTLMQVYECGGWVWHDGDLPTAKYVWYYHKGKTCVGAGSSYSEMIPRMCGCSYYLNYKEKGWEVISPQDFYNKQKITPEMINEINEYFNNKK